MIRFLFFSTNHVEECCVGVKRSSRSRLTFYWKAFFSAYMPLGPVVPVKLKSDQKRLLWSGFYTTNILSTELWIFKNRGFVKKKDCWTCPVNRRFSDISGQMVESYCTHQSFSLGPGLDRELAGNTGWMLGKLDAWWEYWIHAGSHVASYNHHHQVSVKYCKIVSVHHHTILQKHLVK